MSPPVPSFPADAEARHEEGFLNSADHLRLYWQRYTPPSPRATVRDPPRRRRPLRPLSRAHRRGGAGGVPGGARGLPGPRPVRRPALARRHLRRLPLGPGRVRREALAGRRGARAALRDRPQPGRARGGAVGPLARAARARLRALVALLPARAPAAAREGARRAARRQGRAVAAGLDRARRGGPHHRSRAAALDRARSPLRAHPRRRAGSTSRARRSSRCSAARASSRRRCSCSRRAPTGSRTPPPRARSSTRRGSPDKRLEMYAGFRHEIFNEVERDRPIAEAIAWLRGALCGERPSAAVDAPRRGPLSCPGLSLHAVSPGERRAREDGRTWLASRRSPRRATARTR